MRFNELVQLVLCESSIRESISNNEFHKVRTHNVRHKPEVKQLQNEFILSRVPNREPDEIMLGLVGHADGLQAHLQEYNELGFSLGQIFIFENQEKTYYMLRGRARELGIPYTTMLYSTLDSPDMVDKLKIYNYDLNVDLRKSMYELAINKLIPHISHVDYDAVSDLQDVDTVTHDIQTYFKYPATKSLVMVHTMPRRAGGVKSFNTVEIERLYNDLMNTVCIYTHNVYDPTTDAGGTLDYYISKFAQKVYYNIERRYHIKKMIKELISTCLQGGAPVNVYFDDLCESIKKLGNISAKIIPYTGLSNMVSIVAVKDGSSDVSVDYSLQFKTLKSKEDLANTVNALFANWFTNNVCEKRTGKPIVKYILDYVGASDVPLKPVKIVYSSRARL